MSAKVAKTQVALTWDFLLRNESGETILLGVSSLSVTYPGPHAHSACQRVEESTQAAFLL